MEFAKLRANAFAIIERSFQESRDALEPDVAGEFASCVTWTPNFDVAPRIVSPAEREQARQASYSVAYAITSRLDRPRFVTAYAAAIFALNPDGALEAENAASATVTGASRVNVSLGPVSGGIGAEIGYTSKGGLTTDVSGGLTGELNGEYGRSTQVTIETSARRGSTLSVKAEQNLNPYSGEVDDFLKDVSKEFVGDKFPFSTSVTKEL